MSAPMKTLNMYRKSMGRWLCHRKCSLVTISRRNISGNHVGRLSNSPLALSTIMPMSFLCQSDKVPVIVHTCKKHMQTCVQASPLAAMPNNYDYLSCSNELTRSAMMNDMLVYENFITEDEEKSLLNEVEPYLKRLRYEADHWDNAIHGYRETERRKWNEANSAILERVRSLAFPPSVSQIAYVHVLDLTADGVIKPHVDSVRFCGDTITGLSILSSSVMRLTHEKDKSNTADFLLSRRSLYIMRASARYDYSHEVLGNENSNFKGQKVEKGRRISVICRNHAMNDESTS